MYSYSRRSLLNLLLTGIVLTTMALSAPAQSSKPTWQSVRTTGPDTLDELKLLQETVKSVVDKVTPATVAVILGRFDHSKEGPQPVGAGSGVIVSADGYVLTAAHVIEPPSMPFGIRPSRQENLDRPTTVRLILPGQIEVSARILGRNSNADSGMVKIIDPVPERATWPGAKEGKWPYVEIGESAKLKTGQWVLSLGHPGGPKPDRRAPVRVGQVVSHDPKTPIVITDCALVGGDSGGPLFDLEGKLVGIHSRIGEKLDDNIHVPTKAYQDEWKRMARGDVIGREGKLGMGMVLTTRESNVVRIESIQEESPAEKAGLKVDDQVVTLNGHEVSSTTDFREILTQFRANEIATVVIRRGQELIETKVKVIRDGQQAETPRTEDSQGIMGVQLNRTGNKEPKVERFSPNSPAEKAGLKVDDVIVKLNDNDVSTTDDVDKRMLKLRADATVKVLVRRGEEYLEFQFKLMRRKPN
jgi:serine protease Do